MEKKRYDPVWCVVMFDLPTKTMQERREAGQFRKLLLDYGFAQVQFSVYGIYSPSVASNMKVERLIRRNLPATGEVRIFHLTDHQWASATRFRSRKPVKNEESPSQMLLF